MLKASAIEHYGSECKVAEALGITRSAVNQWRETVPPLSAMRLDELTNGVLKFDANDYAGRYGRGRPPAEGRVS